MSSLHDSTVGDFTRGGQVTIHFLRMMWQVVKQFAGAMFILYVLMTAGIWFYTTDPHDRYFSLRWIGAKVGQFYENGPNATQIEDRDGTVVTMTIDQIAGYPPFHDLTIGLAWRWLYAMGYSAGVSVTLLLLILVWLRGFGARQRDERHLRGGVILEAKQLGEWLRSRKMAGKLEVAGVPLVQGGETQHILISGSPGTGKSTTIHKLMQQIRARGDRALVYSPSGDFIEWFYKKGDVVLNPFDERCPSWNLFDEVKAQNHPAAIAAAIIAEKPREDPFFTPNGRRLIAALIREQVARGEGTVGRFLELLNQVPMDELYAYLKDTNAAALVDPEAGKTAANIRSTAAGEAESFQYLPLDGDTFSISDWVAKDEGSQWVFLNAKANQLAAVRNILSAWLQVFVDSMLSLDESRTRRVWLIIDELPSLNAIPSLAPFLEQGRKFGGCGVIAFQQQSQLKKIYGPEGSSTLCGLCATQVYLRQNDNETADWTSKQLGEIEVMESRQGLSYGANEIRDGVSLGSDRKKRQIVLPSEVFNLADLEGYIRMGKDIPIGHFQLTRKKIPSVAKAFMPRDIRLKVSLRPEATVTAAVAGAVVGGAAMAAAAADADPDSAGIEAADQPLKDGAESLSDEEVAAQLREARKGAAAPPAGTTADQKDEGQGWEPDSLDMGS